MKDTMLKALAEQLVAHGWVRNDGAAVASKDYETAVGPRTAFVYLEDYGPGEESYLLSGDYQSEGRNCLSSHGIEIPKTAGAELIAQRVREFVLDADAAVSQTYAAKLLRTRPTSS